MNPCPLCFADNETVLWHNARLRIIAVKDNPQVPAYCRVVWQAHIAEMTDLAAAERAEIMDAVYAAERALHTVFSPDKINLAALGNQVPHLHWHVIGRFADDAFFPDAVWASPRREKVFRLPENAFTRVAQLLQSDAQLARWKSA